MNFIGRYSSTMDFCVFFEYDNHKLHILFIRSLLRLQENQIIYQPLGQNSYKVPFFCPFSALMRWIIMDFVLFIVTGCDRRWMLHPSSRSILTGFSQSKTDISYLLIEKSRLAIRYSTCNTCTDSCTRRKYWNKQRFIFLHWVLQAVICQATSRDT